MILRLEAIGDHMQWLREVGVPVRRPWIAEIVSIGFGRKFLRGQKDYLLANSIGSRGVYVYYNLHHGKLYEVNELATWGRTDRYFAVVGDEDEIVRLSREEAEEWLLRSI